MRDGPSDLLPLPLAAVRWRSERMSMECSARAVPGHFFVRVVVGGTWDGSLFKNEISRGRLGISSFL